LFIMAMTIVNVNTTSSLAKTLPMFTLRDGATDHHQA